MLLPALTRRPIRVIVAAAAVTLLALGLPAQAGVDVAGQRVGAHVPFASDNVDVLGSIPFAGIIGATFKGNVMYATGVEGLRTFDITNPATPVPMGALPLPHFENEDVSLDGNTLLISADHAVGVNVLYVIDVADPRAPMLRNAFRVSQSAHTSSCVPNTGCRWDYMAGGSGVAIVDTTTGVTLKKFATTEARSSHDVQFDSAGYAWVVGSGGTSGWDVTDPTNPKLVARTNSSGACCGGPLNNFIHHNSFRPDVTPGVPGDVVLVTEEDYMNVACSNAGLFETWKINGALSTTTPATLSNLSAWDVTMGSLPTGEDTRAASAASCSSHYFTESGGLVANAWYQQGVRFLDVSNPNAVRQVGYFVIPEAEVWAAHFSPTDPTRQIVYVLDTAHGIDVLRIHRDQTSVAVSAPLQFGPPLSQPSKEWGYACPLAPAVV
jgi:hypothetical protein